MLAVTPPDPVPSSDTLAGSGVPVEVTVSAVLLSLALPKFGSPLYEYVIGYGVPEAGIVAVGNVVVEKFPELVMVAFCVMPLIVIETVSPLGGKLAGAFSIVPLRLIVAVPAGIDCEFVRPLKKVAGTPLPTRPTV